MPVERRLREGLRSNAGILDPEVDRFLSTVVRRTRRRLLARRVMVAVTCAALLAGLLAVAPRGLGRDPKVQG